MTVQLHHGNCLEVMRGMADNSVDAVVTDPPYGLSFMGRDWDHGVPGEAFWREALRVAKPGAHLLAFGGTRTYHRLACAIEDAGWEIRDCVMWLYGSGFPKSHDVSKAIDREAGAERERIGTKVEMGVIHGQADANKTMHEGWRRPWRDNPDADAHYVTAPATPAAREWSGWGTALKPAWEPVIVARKPLQGTVAANVLAWGTGGLNIDGCRVEGEPWQAHDATGLAKVKFFTNGDAPVIHKEPHAAGRWPANLIHDGSDEVLAGFPVTTSGKPAGTRNAPNGYDGGWGQGVAVTGFGDTGSAARFFYCAKSSRADRDEGLEGRRVKLREDLTDEQRKYVMDELARHGVAL